MKLSDSESLMTRLGNWSDPYDKYTISDVVLTNHWNRLNGVPSRIMGNKHFRW